MVIDIKLPEGISLKPRITLFGVGGAGGNATNNMIKKNLEGVNFVVANTDSQALENSIAKTKIQLGVETTKGLGAGAVPDIGAASAEEAISAIYENLQNSNMVFVTAGMGGGTGTGAAPVIAKVASEMDILTVGVVTKPFNFEGSRRMRIAEEGIKELQKYVDTLIIIPNQNLFRISSESTTLADAFIMADEVLYSGVRSITDLMVMPGLINLDFADVRSVMKEMGKAMMGTGEAEGENRALVAAEEAISNPLLDNVSMSGANGVLINITGGQDMTLFEVDEAANRIRKEVDESANIIFGSAFDEKLNGWIRVSVVATGIGKNISDNTLENSSLKEGYTSGEEVSNNEGLYYPYRSEERERKEETTSSFNTRNNEFRERPNISADAVNLGIFDNLGNNALFKEKPLEPEENYQSNDFLSNGVMGGNFSNIASAPGSGLKKNPEVKVESDVGVRREPPVTKRVLRNFSAEESAGRVVAVADSKTSNNLKNSNKKAKSEGFFDIPAFLRRKIND